jgi:hypothetical protein
MAGDFFGQGNFTISVIGNTGNTSTAGTSGCNVDPAAESKILFNTADTRSSICDENYSKGLNWLLGFGFKKMKPTYQVPAQFMNGEFQIFIVLNGRESLLTPDDYVYDDATQLITIKKTVPFVNKAQIIARRK